MISTSLSNRLIFVFSLAGLLVSAFLVYEYHFAASVVCPIGVGCDIVRTSPYSSFFGISIPVLGVAFYLGMATLAIIQSQKSNQKLVIRLLFLGAIAGVGFGTYLTFLELFVIKAICFWCVISYIISIVILLSAISTRKLNEN